MKISPLNFISRIKYKKIEKPENSQTIEDDMLFIRMLHYGKKHSWAKGMRGLIYQLSSMISEDKSFDEVYSKTLDGIHKINGKNFSVERGETDAFMLCPYLRGEEYFFTYYNIIDKSDRKIIKPKAQGDYEKANTCEIGFINYIPDYYDKIRIKYGYNPGQEHSNIELAAKTYDELKAKKDPSIDEINKAVATINWLIVQENPYMRGNDSIAGTIARAIYHSYNVELSPVRIHRSLDFEAFCRDLEDYIKVYPELFDRLPKKRD